MADAPDRNAERSPFRSRIVGLGEVDPATLTARWHGPTNEVTVWEADRSAVNDMHPTQKPVVLAERAVSNSASAGDIVLDPFLGSGTTLIAAERQGRRCYAMEIEPRYVDVSVRRWEEYTGGEAVLDGSLGETFAQVAARELALRESAAAVAP